VWSEPPAASRPVPVWPGWLRAAHWGLVASVLGALLSGFSLLGLAHWHEWLGGAAAAVMLLRVLRGLAGTGHHRWQRFVHGPRATWAYARQLHQGRAPRYLGHNPLGAWMILALLGTVAALGLSGGLLLTDAFWGDPDLAAVHAALAWGLMALVAGHLIGVVWTGHRERVPLVRAMLTGRKPSDGREADAQPPAAR